jgi:hypothetical protein
MDSHAIEYYTPYSEGSTHSHFHAVIALHDNSELDWEEVSILAPRLPKGWYELSHLPVEDRIDFTREFWLSKIPYHPDLTAFLNRFFGSLDDIGIFLVQQKYDDPFEAHFVYSLSNDSGFFHGGTPAVESEIIALQKAFPNYILPPDYLAFLQIHNGFAKLTDTGIMKIPEMEEAYQNFQDMLEKEDPLIAPVGREVNPKSLIPFYKSFGMPFFQCFWGEWYPSGEMGNVYYSNITKTISDCTKTDFRVETMAFETFTDWLMFYLETIE